VLVLEGLEEEGVFRIAGLDGIAGVAAGLPAGSGVEKEAAFVLRGGAVALVTFLREDGTDVGLEEVELLRCWGGEGMAAKDRRERKEEFFHARSLRVMVSAAWMQRWPSFSN
jgi:hypothetical protein